MQPNFKLAPRRVNSMMDQSVTVAYDRIENGVVVFNQDSQRVRTGTQKYPQYVEKVEGYSILNNTNSSASGGKGGIMYIDPDTTNADRSRLIYALNNTVYLYSVTNDTNVVLRDVNTIDSFTLTFLSGVQTKKNAYFSIGDSTMTAELYKYTGTSSGSITVFADAGGGQVTVTSASHGMQNGNTVTITGTTSYNGTFVIAGVTANTFEITDTWVANDATGSWTGETLAKVTTTASNASRLLGVLDDRIISSGIGANSTVAQYSYLSTSAAFSNFTSSTNILHGGELSGMLGTVNAYAFSKGLAFAFENDRVTAHSIGTYDVSGSGRLKDTVTINEAVSISGIGVKSSKGVTVFNDTLYFASPGKGVYGYDPVGGRLNNLMESFRPLVDDFDFTDSSLVADRKRNLLYVTASSAAGIGADRVFVYSFDTKTWSIDKGKYVNQLFWDQVNEKVLGLSSSGGDVIELYNGQYSNSTDDTMVTAETRMYDMGDKYNRKRFVKFSVVIGAASDTQQFTFKVYIDDETDAVFEETKTLESILTRSGEGAASWGNSSWGNVLGEAAEDVGYVTYNSRFNDQWVKDFEKVSVEVSEVSPNRAVIYQPKITFGLTSDEIDTFNE